MAGLSLVVRADEKVFRNGDFLMGFTTSFRMGQLLRYKLNPPRRHPDDRVAKYMVVDFIDAVRECLKAGGWASKPTFPRSAAWERRNPVRVLPI